MKNGVDGFLNYINLLEAVYFQAIKDVLSGWKNKNKNYDYRSAKAFLNGSEKGKRILAILDNLTDEQKETLLNTRAFLKTNETRDKECDDEGF